MGYEEYSLVTTKELRDYMSGIGLTSFQEAAAETVLAGLQGDLERHCQRAIGRVKEYTEIEWTDGQGLFFFKHTPVLSIVNVKSLPSQTIITPLYTNWRIFPGGVELEIEDAYLQVTYTAGLMLDEAELESVKRGIMEAASRIMTDKHDDTISIKDGLDRDTQPAQPQEWLPEELAKFDRYRRRTAV